MVESASNAIYYDPYLFDIDGDPCPSWKRLRNDAPHYHK